MVVLCVGPDCAGKTTMIKKLVEAERAKGFQLRLHKVSPPFSEYDYDSFIERLREQLDDGEYVVWDRVPLIDDFVYSHTLDNKSSYYEISNKQQEVAALLRRCVIVYIHAMPEVLIDRARERAGENDKYLGQELSAEKLQDICDEYEEQFRALGVQNSLHGIDTSLMNPIMAAESLRITYERCNDQMKTQKIAHIVSRDSLYLTVNNQYHMCLGQLCNEGVVYKGFFKKRASEGKFVLLDNGAAEGTTTGIQGLFDLAIEMGVSEVVLPDKLQDMMTTLQRTTEAYRKWVDDYDEMPFRVMAVPQGKNLREWKQCAETMIEKFPAITSYGVPKVLAANPETPFARYEAVEYLVELLEAKGRQYNTDIHLLGMNEPPMVIASIFQDFPQVRGIDSAFAYLCTKASKPISTPYTERPEGVKIEFLSDPDLGMKQHINMELLNMMLVNNENGVDYSW